MITNEVPCDEKLYSRIVFSVCVIPQRELFILSSHKVIKRTNKEDYDFTNYNLTLLIL
jgi:hypothetical protein